jgi:hypothetical protein
VVAEVRPPLELARIIAAIRPLRPGQQAIGKAKEINPQAFDLKALSDVNLNK